MITRKIQSILNKKYSEELQKFDCSYIAILYDDINSTINNRLSLAKMLGNEIFSVSRIGRIQKVNSKNLRRIINEFTHPDQDYTLYFLTSNVYYKMSFDLEDVIYFFDESNIIDEILSKIEVLNGVKSIIIHRV